MVGSGPTMTKERLGGFIKNSKARSNRALLFFPTDDQPYSRKVIGLTGVAFLRTSK